MVFNSILQAIGSTPIIKLDKIKPQGGADIYAKAEFLNAGGSIKSRTAYEMVIKALKNGEITSGGGVVEATSGNQGIGLAMVSSKLGLKCVLVMPDSVSQERKKLMELYGATVVLIEDNNDIGKAINECIQRAKLIAREKKYYFCNQFANQNNLLAHYKNTANEIIKDLGTVDGFCAGIGTGGTLTGIGHRLKELNENTLIWAIEPEKGAILSGKKVSSHIQMGIGDGIIPQILNLNVYNKICLVSDKQALFYAKKLAQEEGIACGISSGSNIYGAIKLSKELGKGKKVLTILPDGAERYFSTQLFND